MKNKTVLIIGMVWPEPQSSAAGTRMLQLINLYVNQGFTLIFASTAQKSDYSFPLQSIGIREVQIQLNNATFDVFIKELNPEIVVFDRFIIEEQFGWRVSENCPKAIRILDSIDLHCLRLERQKAVKSGFNFDLNSLLNSDTAIREIASIYRCNLTLVISEFEIEILQSIFNISSNLVYYLPLFYDSIVKDNVPFENRNDFVFIGNFLHEPNWDAVKQLKEHIWPVIRKQLPQAKMNIYGAYPSQKVFQLNDVSENFIIHGRAKNAFDIISNAKVLLAPLRFGAGLKGKLIEAMQVGTPSITTGIGAEGISETNFWNGFVANSNDEFAIQAVLLYQAELAWKQAQTVGYTVIEKFDIKLFSELFYLKTTELLSNIEKINSDNFIGKILFSQHYSATKYMSKWIEEKNKK